jgi:2-methylfumaryl-CoA hydratase
MVRKRGADETAWRSAPTVPELPAEVDPRTLWFDEALLPSAADSGSTWSFEDYQVGERIHHFDAMVVNPSDHMSLTRLAQNSAKVHFDAYGMAGRPLVYGGVIISHAYALAFNGLQGRSGVVAINGGAHANPTYAGDTLYAWTDVVGSVPLTDSVGALRLRLVATKNVNPAETEIPLRVPDDRRPCRDRYHEQVVLDLDVWDLVARR